MVCYAVATDPLISSTASFCTTVLTTGRMAQAAKKLTTVPGRSTFWPISSRLILDQHLFQALFASARVFREVSITPQHSDGMAASCRWILHSSMLRISENRSSRSKPFPSCSFPSKRSRRAAPTGDNDSPRTPSSSFRPSRNP